MAGSDTSIGGYRLGQKVRTGPHLAVFAGEDNLGREIEIACYRAKSLRDRTGVDAFLAEARKSATLHHENLCPMINAGEEGEVWFSISVAPDAPGIRDLLERGGPLAPERVAVVAEKILAALSHMQDADLRHGDVRPETVFLSGPRVLLAPRRLIPLGLAERDLDYVSPEEIRADGTDLRADLFAFGVVLFEALTGRRPFSGEDAQERLKSIAAGPPELPPGLPAGLARLVPALLAARQDDRPSRPQAAADLLTSADPTAIDVPAQAVAARPAAEPPRPPARRSAGAFRYTRAGEDALHELWSPETFVAPGANGPRFAARKMADAVARIERGETTDEIQAMAGADPHPRVNGSLIDRHELAKDDVVKIGAFELTYGAARADPKRPAMSTTRRERGMRAAILVAFLLSLAVVGWGYVRISEALNAGGETIAEVARVEKELAAARSRTEQGGTGDSGLSVQAKIDFEKAKAFAGDCPEDFDGIRSRFEAIRDTYGPTAYGYLAQKEMDENEARRRAARDREFDTLAKEAAACIDAGRLYDACEMLENYERTHPGTLYAGRAEREALNLLETIAARFDEDMDRAHRLTQEGDFGTALDILAGVKTYAGPDERTKAEREIRAIRKRIRETQLPEGAGATPAA
ncbi:MAG: protein kinase, partial [Planctomycetota bacterium]